MSTRFCLFKLKLSSAVDYRLLMLDIVVEYLRKREHLRLVIDKRKHIDSAGVLHLRILIELIKNNLRISVAAILDNDTHTVSARLVTHLGNALDTLFVCKVCNSLAKHTLIYAIGDLGYDNSVLVFLDLSLCSYHYASLTRGVRLDYAVNAIDRSFRGEVGALEVVHKLKHLALGVIHTEDSSVYNFTEVMRRDICSHTYRDTHSSVYKEIGEAGRKHARLTETVIKVRSEVNYLFLEILHKLVSDLCHSRLGITVSRRAVAVNGTEVSVSFNKRITVREVLSHSYHSSVNRRVTVRMVSTKHVTDRRCRLSERLVACQMVLVHRVHNSSLTGLHSVSYVRKRTRCNNRHGILDKGSLYLLFHINVYYFLISEFYVFVFQLNFLPFIK